MRIAVIADTHNHYPARFPELLSSADEIWHLGDVCAPETLAEFEALGIPLRVVLGNNDACPAWPPQLLLGREGYRFQLIHIPPHKAHPGVDVVLHGHTHIPRDDMLGGVRWLNPGSISHPKRSADASFAWLTVRENKPLGWKLMWL